MSAPDKPTAPEVVTCTELLALADRWEEVAAEACIKGNRASERGDAAIARMYWQQRTTLLDCAKEVRWEARCAARKLGLVGAGGLLTVASEAGYVVAEGPADVRNLIHAASGDDEQPLCSGWRVFPDGARCQGCADCSPNVRVSDGGGR